METVCFSGEYDSPVTSLIYPLVKLLHNRFHAYGHGHALRIIFVEVAADTVIELLKVVIAPLPASPIYFGKCRFVVVLGMQPIKTFVQIGYSGL